MKRDIGEPKYVPPMPETSGGEYLIGYLFEVGPIVPAGMGVGPVSHQELLAWQSLMGFTLSPWETRVIRRLSGEYLMQSRLAEKRDCKAPWQAAEAITEVTTAALSLKELVKQMANL